MTQDDLFANPELDEPHIDPNKSYLEDLVGEGKKFRDAESLAKGKAYADAMIDMQNKRFDDLSAEYRKLREESMAKASLEEMINQISQQRSAPEANTQPKAEIQQPTIDPNELEVLVEKKIQASEKNRRETTNANMVKSKLKETWGPSYANVLREKTEALGLSDAFVNGLAKENPEALYRVVGLNQPTKDPYQAPPENRSRGSQFTPSAPKARTWAYYQDLKAKDPLAWMNPNVGAQMAKDAAEQGDAFYDGNFYTPGLHER